MSNVFDKNFTWLFKNYVSRHKPVLIYCLFFSVFQSLLLLPSVYFIKLIFDKDIPNKDMHSLLIHSALIVGVTVLQSLATQVTRASILKVVKSAVQTLQRDLLKGLIEAERKFHDTTNAATLSNKVVGDVEQVDIMMHDLFTIIIPQSILLAVGTLAMVIYNPLIGVSAAAMGLLGLLIRNRFRKKIFVSIRKNNEAKDNLSAYVSFIPPKQVLIKMKDAEKIETLEAYHYSDHVIREGTQTAKQGWQIRITDELTINLAATVLIVLGSLQILWGYSSYGNIFGLYFLIVFVRRTVTLLQTSWSNIQSGNISLERIMELRHQINSSPDNKKKISIDFQGNLLFCNVSFGYDKNVLLRKVDFEIQAGEVVCITGSNGAGKSSLLGLLLGFYKPDGGEIFADKKDYNELHLGHLRSQIGYVPQKQIILTGTIETNLTYGLDDSCQAMAIAQLKKSPLFNHLMDGFTDGLETKIKENGINLSNGQIQRLSLLRALVGSPGLLVLDEPTNHLDSQALIALVGEIKNQIQIGILIISHHTVFQEIADRTYQLENGISIQLSYENQFKSSERQV